MVNINNNIWNLEIFTIALNEIYKIHTPINLTSENLLISIGIAIFVLMLYETYNIAYKKNMQENTYGSAEWKNPKDIIKKRDEVFENNTILTETEFVSKNMKKSGMNRHVILLGRPGTGKSRYYFKPNILNATGTIIVTDPKGELLRDCGYSLKQKGYIIKVLNLDEKSKSNTYNPFLYIKENEEDSNGERKIQEDDVMSLINTLILNTKSENIENTSGDPFWEKAEMIYLQSLFYYTISHYEKRHQNFTTILKLIRLSEPDSNGVSALDELFKVWEKKEPNAVGVKQYKHFKVAASAPKMMSTIIMVATARLAAFNIQEIANLTETDNMELGRIGMPIDNKASGKIAYFIITKPSDSTFNFLASIFYTQVFAMIDENAKKCGGSLTTGLEIYMDEWAQLGEIPRFVEELAYLRGLNVGITIGLQSLSQLKKKYKDSWESVLDCCDTTLFLGSNSKETLEYMVALLGKKTWYKKSNGRTFSRQGSSSTNWDVVGRELATLDELSKMQKGNCILFLSTIGAFYSQLFNLTKHPRYNMLYESWIGNKEKEYNHKNELDYIQNSNYKLLTDSGLVYAKIVDNFKIESVDEVEIENILKTGIFELEDLKKKIINKTQ